MAAATLPGLLDTLSQSLSSALEATPKLSGIEPPKDGLSLLDVKNELLLSYLQNLVFLILLKIRQARNGNSGDAESSSALDDAVVKKLVELRLYLDKGVRPLEDKLRYQIEKVLRAADDAERNAKALETAKSTERDQSGSESGSGSDEGSDEDDQDEGQGRKISDLQYRPNLSAFVRPAAASAPATKKDPNGVYRPPKVAPTVMPTTERRERTDRRALKSATMDEYIADELSAAPMAEPSIGTTIVQGGRKTKTASERKAEAERLDYEERNFVRLPKESKKDRAQKAKAEGRRGRMNFGGEEWRDLGAGVDRINRLTKSKGTGGGMKALLDKSRKRGFETVDGPRGSGSASVEIGDRFQKRLKTLERGRGKRR